MQPHHRDVAFLLSFGALQLACQDKNSSDDDTSTGAGPNPTTGPSSPTDATTDDTDGIPTTDVGTTGEASAICQSYSDHLVECLPYYAMYAAQLVMYCEGTIAYGTQHDGPACAEALEAHFVCLNAIPCADLEHQGEMLHCDVELTNKNAACPSLDDSSVTESGDTVTDPGDTEATTTGATEATTTDSTSTSESTG